MERRRWRDLPRDLRAEWRLGMLELARQKERARQAKADWERVRDGRV